MEDLHKKMTCLLRLKRYTVYEIADELSILAQSVHMFLKTLPGEVKKGDTFQLPDLSEEQIEEIIDRYLADEALSYIAEDMEIDIDDIVTVFQYIKCKLKKRTVSVYYPKVAEWMNQNNYLIKDFAKEIGVSASTLSRVFSGKYHYHMTAALAEKIHNHTGLAFSDIFYVQLEKEGEKDEVKK